MKTTLAFYFYLMLFFISLIYAGCSKDEDNAEKDTEDICKEIRADLTGDIVFINKSNHVMKTTFQGSSFKLGNSTLPPKWSPEGNLIAFIENDNENTIVKIFNKNGNEENSWLLMPSIQSDGINPLTWSPDGTTIAILNRLSEIIYLNVSNGEKTMTQIGQEETSIRSIAWCPRNNKIAIAQYLGVNSKSIFMINAFEDNPNKELLVTTEDFVEYMDWNTDGSKLVYSGFGYGSVYTINFNGTENQKIITKGIFEKEPVFGFAPCWMSNGNQIIYVGITGIEGSTLIPGLFVTETEGAYNVNLEIEGTKPDCI